MLNIHVIYEHLIYQRPFSTAYIRVLLPLTHPANNGIFAVSYDCEYAPADIIIIERTWKPDLTLRQAEEIVARTRHDHACLIYTIDDDLLDLYTPDGSRHLFSTERLMAVRYLARAADGIIVSTVPLKRRLALLNANIYVVPNALDERLCSAPAAPSRAVGGRKVIGYMGSHTHDADFMMILQPLRELLHKHRDHVEFQIVGGLGDARWLQALADLPVQVLNATASSDYPLFMPWMAENLRWDLAIAPLEDTPFTRCKSDIKALDYGIQGIPGIFSRVPAYENTIRHLETGWLASNDPSSWQAAFETLLQNDQLRRQLGRNMQEFVRSTRTLQHCAPQWRAAILDIYRAHSQRHDHNLLAWENATAEENRVDFV